jgi:hypothetical protein
MKIGGTCRGDSTVRSTGSVVNQLNWCCQRSKKIMPIRTPFKSRNQCPPKPSRQGPGRWPGDQLLSAGVRPWLPHPSPLNGGRSGARLIIKNPSRLAPESNCYCHRVMVWAWLVYASTAHVAACLLNV